MKSNIEWTDYTFNPWVGCTKISPACDHCYAEAWAKRAGKSAGVTWGGPRRRTSPANWKTPLRWNAEHNRFFSAHGRRQRVFCASLADVFDNEIPASWRADLFSLIRATPNLEWLLLSKRIGNAIAMMDEAGGWRGASEHSLRNPLPNVWLGATICNQAEADRDIPKLMSVPAAVRFLSVEPMLGPVGLTSIRPNLFAATANALTGEWRWDEGPTRQEERHIDWVIVGGESGPKARPMHPDWVRSLRDQCAKAGVPFMFKQWGEWLPVVADGDCPIEACDGTERCLPGNTTCDSSFADQDMARVGKKTAGRLLDGVTHDSFPSPTTQGRAEHDAA